MQVRSSWLNNVKWNVIFIVWWNIIVESTNMSKNLSEKVTSSRVCIYLLIIICIFYVMVIVGYQGSVSIAFPSDNACCPTVYLFQTQI